MAGDALSGFQSAVIFQKIRGVRGRSPARPSIADFELPSWEKVKAKFQKGGILIGNGAISLVRTRFHSRHSSEP
jgi:hypothetical protein